MEKVAKITFLEAQDLIGQMYAPDSFFNPVQECDGSWIITIQEIEQCVNPEFEWVKYLPLTDWCGPYIPVSGTTF